MGKAIRAARAGRAQPFSDQLSPEFVGIWGLRRSISCVRRQQVTVMLPSIKIALPKAANTAAHSVSINWLTTDGGKCLIFTVAKALNHPNTTPQRSHRGACGDDRRSPSRLLQAFPWASAILGLPPGSPAPPPLYGFG